jgi:hypothetical protein
MADMYRIIGVDGRQYGPITADQLRQWVVEGRANAQTQTFVAGATEWKPLGTLPGFASHFAAGNPPVIGLPRPDFSRGPFPKTNSFATAGLIFGILSLTCCCCGFPLNILGLAFSLIGLSQINRHPELYEGRGIAVAGLIISLLSFFLGFGLVLLRLALNPANFAWHFKTF